MSLIAPLFMVLFSAAVAMADVGWYGGINGGYLFHEGDEEYEGSQLYGITVGNDIDPRWSWEGTVAVLPELDKNETFNGGFVPEGDALGVDLRVSALYHLNDTVHGLDPFLKITGGWDVYNRGTGHGGSGDPFAGVGFGSFYNMDNETFLRADYTFEPAVETGKIHQALYASYGWRWGAGRRRRLGLDQDAADAGREVLERVYFAFDSAKLDQRAKETLQRDAQWLSQNPSTRTVVEGHCDERGTDEYNLVLGQHRAESAYNYLRGLGIDAKRMTTVSYGEERPADPGHNEAAWAKNRRAQFAVSGQ